MEQNILKDKPYYVLLTGGKNNAGDFLIKYRAIRLLKLLRPDRDIIDVDAWRQRDEELLKLFNGAKAIILTGGPALRRNMYPGIYSALGDITDIVVPIVTMAIGWRAFPGEWSQTHDYPLSNESMQLLRRIESSGYISSVRDYHTLNILLKNGLKSFRMTGCAALFDPEFMNKPFLMPDEVKKVAFSLGVSFLESKEHEENFRKLVIGLRDKFKDKSFDVAFHHSLNHVEFRQAYAKNRSFIDKHIEFSNWLKSQGVSYTDISGSAEGLIDYYSKVDLHIGFRVHAHIFMASINKLSVLISEDGRAKALRDVINGLVIDSEFSSQFFQKTSLYKILVKLNVINELNRVNMHLMEDILNNVEYEEQSGFARLRRTRILIDSLYEEMKFFIANLP